jgi:hypothetical protein
MIFEHNIEYKFPENLLRVSFFVPAFDDSVVLLAQTAVGEDSLFHFSSKSELLFQHNFKEYAMSLSMPSDS